VVMQKRLFAGSCCKLACVVLSATALLEGTNCYSARRFWHGLTACCLGCMATLPATTAQHCIAHPLDAPKLGWCAGHLAARTCMLGCLLDSRLSYTPTQGPRLTMPALRPCRIARTGHTCNTVAGCGEFGPRYKPAALASAAMSCAAWLASTFLLEAWASADLAVLRACCAAQHVQTAH
jgi:hypothetical protein